MEEIRVGDAIEFKVFVRILEETKEIFFKGNVMNVNRVDIPTATVCFYNVFERELQWKTFPMTELNLVTTNQ